MVVVFGVGFGLAAVKKTWWSPNWDDGVWAAIAAWSALGLANQIRDLWSTFRRQTALSRDERFAWQFALFWRAGIACLLVGYYLFDWLREYGLLTLPEREYHSLISLNWRRDDLLFLPLLVAISDTSRPLRADATHTIPTHVWNIVASVGAIMLCFLVWSNLTFFNYLVFLSMTGIEQSIAPIYVALDGTDPNIAVRITNFVTPTLIAAVLVPVNFSLVHRFARQWTRAARFPWTTLVMLTLGLTGTISYSIWVWSDGLFRLSPAFREMDLRPLWHDWISGLPLVVIVVTFKAQQWAIKQHVPARVVGDTWRRNQRSYYHERYELMILVISLCVLSGLSDVLYLDNMFYALFAPSFYLPVAILLVALKRVRTQRRPSVGAEPAEPMVLPVGRFWGIWVALFVVVVSGVSALAWGSFAIWFALPWT